MSEPRAKRDSLKRLVRRCVASPRNSVSSARLSDLDLSTWWTDTSCGQHYLHVQHKDGETVHRVFCRGCDCPRLEMQRGKLMWLYTPNAGGQMPPASGGTSGPPCSQIGGAG